MLTNGNKKDWYLAKYDNNGNFLWVKQAHADSINWYGAVSTDNNGNSYTLGTLSGSATFGSYGVTASSPSDMFVTRYDSSGNCLGVKLTANVLQGGIIGNNNYCYVAGTFTGTATFDANPVTSYGGSDCYLAKLDGITGIQQFVKNNNNQLLIYANPNEGKCNITIPDEFLNEKNLVLSIYDNTGKLIQQKTLHLPAGQAGMNDGKIKLDLEAEAKGVYNVVLSSKKKSYSGKIVFE